MQTHDLTSAPQTDPTFIYHPRDALYAVDMLIAAICWLDFFTWLDAHPSDAAGIRRQFETTPRPTDVMLTLFCAMGLIERRDGVFHNKAAAKEHLVKGSPWFLGPYYSSLRDRPVVVDLLKVLRTGKPANWGSQTNEKDWHKAMETEEFAVSFTAAMDCRGVFLAQAAAKKVDLQNHRRLLDIAGGSGIYACSFAAHHPQLRATVLEKVPVDKIAAAAIAKRGFSERVSVVAGDMLTAPLPADHDVHLISNVLHDWDEPVVKQILAKSFQALPPGGLLILHDAHLNADKTGPRHVAEYSVLLMHSTEGRCYSTVEMEEYLTEAGFREFHFTPTAAARSVLTARKPG